MGLDAKQVVLKIWYNGILHVSATCKDSDEAMVRYDKFKKEIWTIYNNPYKIKYEIIPLPPRI
jgi:hypothetical protein